MSIKVSITFYHPQKVLVLVDVHEKCIHLAPTLLES